MNFLFYFSLLVLPIAFGIVYYKTHHTVNVKKLNVKMINFANITQSVIFKEMDKNIYQRMDELYKIYKNCSSEYPLECGSKYEGRHRGHPPSKYISYLSKFPIQFSVVSQSTKKCFNSSLIISVVSSPDAFINRYSYRKSYSVYKNQYPLYFFVGLSRNETINELVFEENKKYDDMIIFDYLSSYYNNSIQFIMSMRWLNDNCKNYRYILSQQSDTFVNIPYYQKHYERIEENYTVISIIRRSYPVVRDRNQIWYLPLFVYNETNSWPDFPIIAHIFLHKDTVKKIVDASYHLKTILFMDDVYLGMLLKYSNLTKTLRGRGPCIYFYRYWKIRNYSRFKEKVLTMHNMPPGVIYYLSSIIYPQK